MYAALAAPFALKKLGWPPTTPGEGKRADAVRDAVGAAAMRAYDDAARGADPSDDRLARRVDRLAANAGAIEGKAMRRRRFEKTIEGEGDGRRADGGRGRSTDASGASASLTAEERWTLGWVAWTEEAAHVAKVMRDEYHVPANPHATVSSAVLTAHLPMARANAVDRDRGSGARYARVDTADLGGLARVLRETMRPASNARGSSADAFFVRRDEAATFMRILCAARGDGAPEDAMTRWGATRPKTRTNTSRPKTSGQTSGETRSGRRRAAPSSRRASGAGAETSSKPRRAESRTTRKGRGGASGRERTENGTETGRRRDGGTRRDGGGRRDGRATRGEDTEYAYLADDGLDPDEPL